MTASDEASATLHPGWLRLSLGAGQGHADFHLRWLRHQCALDLHPQTGERTADSCELPDDLQASSAQVREGKLLVRWAHDNRESSYEIPWLLAHAYARDRVDQPPPSEVDQVTLRWGERGVDEVVSEALRLLRTRGVTVVRRGAPDPSPAAAEGETEAILRAFARHGLKVVETHFGFIEDLRTDNTTNKNTDQLGYTDAAVDLHTDQPFLHEPPRYQLLQSIRAAYEGGDSYLVDAEAAARYLASIDAQAHELLTSTPVRFHRKQKSFERVVEAPILDTSSGRFRVRYSYFTHAPFRLPFERMEAWYRAYDRFARLVRDPRNQLRTRLLPGDFVVYDNHRMLHARTGFRGPRWVRGVYFDEESPESARPKDLARS